MDILLITTDRHLRDTVKVGLQQFPEFRVACGTGMPGLNQLRVSEYDLVFLELGHTAQDCLNLVKYLRSFDNATELIALGDDQMIRDLGREKQRYGINSFLRMPLDVTDFFRLVSRLRARRSEAANA